MEKIEKYALSKSSKPKTLFGKVGLIGCGEVGRSIARMVSARGMDVVFVEISDEQIEKSLNSLSLDIDAIIERWGMVKSEKRAILSRIKGSTNYEILKECDIVIEAIVSKSREKLIDERKDIFEKLEKYVSKNTVIATNSTTVVITELSSGLKYPERCVSFHFISPAPDARIVEVVRGIYTSDETYEKVKKFSKLLGKKFIGATESPGIISTRLVVPLINEACEILMEGVGSMTDIDCTMSSGFGIPLGPFAMADKIGLDKLLRWCENLYQEFGDLKYKASPVIKKYVRANLLGRKTGKGFYEYDKYGNRLK